MTVDAVDGIEKGHLLQRGECVLIRATLRQVGGGRKLRYRGRERNRAWSKINIAVYNLIRITNLDELATT